MFRGSFDHNLDDKGRLAIPAAFRKLLQKDSEPATLIITNFDQCLVAYDLEKWQKLEEKLAALPQFDPKVVAFQRYFIAGAVECPIDKAGRILIPQNLRQFAGISRESVIVGNLTKFEIWSKDRWERTLDSLSDNITNLASSMGDLGISL